MKKTAAITALALVLGLTAEASAQTFPAQSGYTGPAAPTVTVAEAKKLSDDTPVVMVGKIEKSLGGEKYSFADQTGSIVIEIDNEDWNGVTANADSTVQIHGEIDKDFTNIEVDVSSVALKK